MPKILISSISNKQSSVSAQNTGFNTSYIATGCVSSAALTKANMRNYSRSLQHATETKANRTNLSGAPARICQGAGGFSRTSIYLMKGYNGSDSTASGETIGSTVVNKVAVSTDSNSSPSISFTTERRGPYVTCPTYFGRIYFITGYNDVGSAYTNLSNYINTATDISINTTNFLATRHVGGTLSTKFNTYLFGGYTSGTPTDPVTNNYYKWSFATDTPSSLSTLTTAAAGMCGISHNTYGYLIGGAGDNFAVRKFVFSTETLSAGASLSNYIEYSVPSVSNTTGYCWTGVINTSQRGLLKLAWATGTITDERYTESTDSASGFLIQSGGA